IDDMSVIIRDSQLTPEKEAIVVDRIDKELEADTITVHHDLALVMVVGEGMKETIGMAQTAATALGEAKVNIEMINQGSSEVSKMFGIKAYDLHRAIRTLYIAFFESSIVYLIKNGTEYEILYHFILNIFYFMF